MRHPARSVSNITTFYLVRHGYTGISEFKQVPSDGLSVQGRRQTRRTGRRLSQSLRHRGKIYSSALLRSVESAEIMAKYSHLRVVIDERLNEITAAQTPSEMNDWVESADEEHTKIDLLEKYRDKAIRLLIELTKEHENDAVALVTHGNMIRAIVAEAIDAPTTSIAKMVVHNCGITKLEYHHDLKYFRLSLFNDTAHLHHNRVFLR